jgi:YVTN family beta-propeller protein
MAITPDGKKLYVANGRSNSVSVIDTATNAVSKEITVGELPWGVVIQ